MIFIWFLVSSDLGLLINERWIFSKVVKISKFRIWSGWIEKYEPALSKSFLRKTFELCKEFYKKDFNIKLVSNSFNIKNYFSYKDPIPDDLKSFLVYSVLVLAVVLAILSKLVIILKIGLRSISKRITRLIFLNIYTPLHHALALIIPLVLK